MMRFPRRSTLPAFGIGMLLATAGCSGAGSQNGNGVDVAAAASRGESDIANYAAGADAEPRIAVPSAEVTAKPMPAPAPAPTPAGETAATPDQDPASMRDAASARALVRRYTDALAARRYDAAWALWDEDGRASGMTRAAFAASFARYASFDASVGTPFDADAGAGQRYITVPVVVTGRLTSGDAFRLEGPVILHKVAEGIEGDDPGRHAWRIRRSEMKPKPIGPTDRAPQPA